MESNEFNDEFYDRIEQAAARGVREGSKRNTILYKVIPVAALLLLAVGGLALLKYSLEKKWNSFAQQFQDQFATGAAAGEHDMVLKDEGIMGYTAADFAEAVLGDTSQLHKVEVFEAEISDAVTLTDSGLGNLKIFTKTQVITYIGTATYTVDLSRISKENFFVDENEKKVIIVIPHAECGTINIPSDEMEFEDIERGWLAFGEINMTAEQLAGIETEARTRMEAKLAELHQEETADRFAVMTVWEMYQPVISSVSPDYRLEVVFSR